MSGFDIGAFQYQSSLRVLGIAESRLLGGVNATLQGRGFGASQGASKVYLSEAFADISGNHVQTTIISWTDTEIVVEIDVTGTSFSAVAADGFLIVDHSAEGYGAWSSTVAIATFSELPAFDVTFETFSIADTDWDYWKDIGSGFTPSGLVDNSSLARRWCWETTTTPSAGYGPTAPPSGQAGYVYVETSSPAVSSDEWYMEALGVFSSTGQDTSIEIELWCNSSYGIVTSIGVRKNGSGDPWVDIVVQTGTTGVAAWVTRSTDVVTPLDGFYDIRILFDLGGSGDIWQGDPAIAAVIVSQESSSGDTSVSLIAALESDNSLDFIFNKSVVLDTVTESDTAQDFGFTKSFNLLLATDFEVAVDLTVSKSFVIVLAVSPESDAASTLILSKSLDLDASTEADTANSLSYSFSYTLAPATDTEAGLDLGITPSLALAPAAESSSGLPLSLAHSLSLLVADEGGAGEDLLNSKSLEILTSLEAGESISLSLSKSLGLLTSSEADTGLGLTFGTDSGILLTVASEANQALPLPVTRSTVLTRAEEVNQAIPATVSLSISLLVASEADSGQGLTTIRSYVLTPAVGPEAAQGLVFTLEGGVGGDKTLWDIITENSTLPIATANTLWDHLNNQQGGGTGDITIVVQGEIDFTDIPSRMRLVEKAEDARVAESPTAAMTLTDTANQMTIVESDEDLSLDC